MKLHPYLNKHTKLSRKTTKQSKHLQIAQSIHTVLQTSTKSNTPTILRTLMVPQ